MVLAEHLANKFNDTFRKMYEKYIGNYTVLSDKNKKVLSNHNFLSGYQVYEFITKIVPDYIFTSSSYKEEFIKNAKELFLFDKDNYLQKNNIKYNLYMQIDDFFNTQKKQSSVFGFALKNNKKPIEIKSSIKINNNFKNMAYKLFLSILKSYLIDEMKKNKNTKTLPLP
jgi:pyruvate carboxylase